MKTIITSIALILSIIFTNTIYSQSDKCEEFKYKYIGKSNFNGDDKVYIGKHDKYLTVELENKYNDLNYNSIPNYVFEYCECIEKLKINIDGLKELPAEIGNLTNLKELKIGGIKNTFTELPPEIGNLTNLKELRIYENQLTELPPEIGNLTNLEWVEIEKNNLTSLPPEIGNLTNLKWLDLEKNNLTSLPYQIGKLTKLTYLDLRENNLTSLPYQICYLKRLTSLYISGNDKLTEILKCIYDLPRLEYYSKELELKKLKIIE